MSEPSAPPTFARVGCPNCEHVFFVKAPPGTEQVVVFDELVAQVAAHFSAAHAGESVGLTETTTL